MDNKTLINKFCDKYGLDSKIVVSFIRSHEINDFQSMDLYFMILCENCSDEMVDEMKSDLKKLVDKF